MQGELSRASSTIASLQTVFDISARRGLAMHGSRTRPAQAASRTVGSTARVITGQSTCIAAVSGV